MNGVRVEKGATYTYSITALHKAPLSTGDDNPEEETSQPETLGDEFHESAPSETVEAVAVTMLEKPRLGDRRPHIILQVVCVFSIQYSVFGYLVVHSDTDRMRASIAFSSRYISMYLVVFRMLLVCLLWGTGWGLVNPPLAG